MIKMKSQKGAIALVTLISVIFLLTFSISTYLILQSKAQTQAEITDEIAKMYNDGTDNNVLNEKYYSYFGGNTVIPISTENQLSEINSNTLQTIDGKEYYFSGESSYILMNNITTTNSEWTPSNNILTNSFEWNGHTIISGNYIYNGINQ